MTWFFFVHLAQGVPDTSNMVQISGTNDIPTFWVDQYEYPNQLGVLPTTGVSFEQAQSLCQAQDKRLCTAAEWRLTCSGLEQRRFPYGEAHQRGVCHQSVAGGSSHTALMTADVVPTGTYEACQTPDGVMDLIGNLEEWVLDDWRGQQGMLEGGAAYTHDQYADCTGRYSRMPDYRLSTDQAIFSAGTRCCWSDTPVTTELITLDRRNRLKQVTDVGQYNPEFEVELPNGGWMDQYEYPNQPGQTPRVAVTWTEANQLCAGHGKRLCGAYEWEQACMSEDGRAFSSGQHYVKGACAVERLTPSRSGEHGGCVNPLGVFDMSGGVWEWTATDFQAPFLENGYPESMTGLVEIRGGSWMVEPSKSLCRPDNGYPVTSKNMAFEDVGFRCCRGAEWVPTLETWGAINECPNGMVGIGGFCMDRYEHPNQVGEYPTQQLTWERAQEMCQQDGKRVCSEAEWTLACEGPDVKGYPYGAIYESQRCGTKDRMGTELQRIGTHSRCSTPDGIEDLTGSVWEWTLTQGGQTGVLRGGGSVLSAGLGRCRSRAFVGDVDRVDVGVRCCLTPSADIP